MPRSPSAFAKPPIPAGRLVLASSLIVWSKNITPKFASQNRDAFRPRPKPPRIRELRCLTPICRICRDMPGRVPAQAKAAAN